MQTGGPTAPEARGQGSGGVVTRASKLSVRGRVQMVGYRRHVLDVAWELGVAGYVRNEANGSVTVVAQADVETLKKFRERLANPPPPAEVREIAELAAKAKPRLRDFSIVSGSLKDELREGLGGMQTEFRDYRSEFKDYRAEFKDYRGEFRSFASRTDENFKSLEAKYGAISDKLSEILTTLTDQAKKTQEMLESMRSEAKQTAETLNESLRLLREAVERLPKSS